MTVKGLSLQGVQEFNIIGTIELNDGRQAAETSEFWACQTDAGAFSKALMACEFRSRSL